MKKVFSLFIISAGVTCLISSATPLVSAVKIGDANPCDQGYVLDRDICKPINDIQNPSTTNIYALVNDIINYILIAVGALAVIMIIVSAIRITTSGGDAEKVKKAKNTLLWAVIGLALALLAAVIVNLVIDIANKV